MCGGMATQTAPVAPLVTHDPLCPRSEDHHDHGAHADTVRHFCLCLLIAKVRADERKQAVQRVEQNVLVSMTLTPKEVRAVIAAVRGQS